MLHVSAASNIRHRRSWIQEVASFCAVLREKLLVTSQPFSKEYLQLLVKEIVLTGNIVTVKGGYIPLVGAVKFTSQKKKLSTHQEVLSFNSDWRPLPDLNRCRRRERAVSWARLDEGDV